MGITRPLMVWWASRSCEGYPVMLMERSSMCLSGTIRPWAVVRAECWLLYWALRKVLAGACCSWYGCGDGRDEGCGEGCWYI